jgi:uncharacterized protein (TIGR03435 family)
MLAVNSLICLTAIVAFAQPPAFEVASVRAGQSGRESIESGPGSVTMRNVHLKAAIRWAYGVQDYQISGPGWLNDDWFDIFAKSAAPASETELRRMLQTLLADRFKLTIHRETREIPALILTVGKNGHKLQAVDKEGSPSFKTGKLKLTGEGATVGQLTEFLSRELRDAIIDRTGLTGWYNYTLDINAYITEEIMKSAGADGGPPTEAASIIAQAVQAQLGLKLESRKAPVEMVVVDHAERVPTGN